MIRNCLLGCVLAVALGGCAPCPPATASGPCAAGCGFAVVNVYPHDPAAYTQGLQFVGGKLYESTGIAGESTLRRVALETGVVEAREPLEANYFGEGLAVVGNRIVQLTWQDHVAFVYDKGSFALVETWSYPTEGLGPGRTTALALS